MDFIIDACPSSWTTIGNTCFSPPRKTYEWTDSADCNTNCDAIEKLCTDDGTTLATKEETETWVNNGGDQLGMLFGLTSTRDADKYWFTNLQGQWHPGLWYEGCCDSNNRFFVCAKRTGKTFNL